MPITPQTGLLLDAAEQAGVGNIVTYGFAEGCDWHIAKLETIGDRSFAEIIHQGEQL